MRDGILDQLPKTLPKEQIVIVFGPPENHGQNALKTLINDLNRDGDAEWIRSEFRSQVDSAKVPNRTAVVLTMTGLTHGALANVRRAATNLGACLRIPFGNDRLIGPHQPVTGTADSLEKVIILSSA